MSRKSGSVEARYIGAMEAIIIPGLGEFKKGEAFPMPRDRFEALKKQEPGAWEEAEPAPDKSFRETMVTK